MYALMVTIKLKPEGRARFLAAIEDDAVCSERDEPGCLRFNVMQDESDPNRIHLFEVYRDKRGEFRWQLKALNGQIIAASSESYEERADCQKAVDRIKQGAAKAKVEDET